MDFLRLDSYHAPRICTDCGGVMVYKGVGEYRCEDCNMLAYDDYGKVRNYIEQHKGATSLEIEAATGVTQKSIRQLLRDSRIEIAANSRMFMHCELCRTPIRSGILCKECEMSQHRIVEAVQRAKRRSGAKHVQGYGLDITAHGEKRFVREENN